MTTGRDLIPDVPDLARLAEAAAGCRACRLWERATQTVFGEGPPDAELMLVGEQPGDREDTAGRPFVGPAGAVLRRGRGEAGLDPSRAYVTNAVKHFKWKPAGRRRIHQRPDSAQIAACRPWLEAELRIVQPRALVCLGATAAQALLGRGVRVTRDRGRPLQSDLAPVVMATVHPSSILRAPDAAARDAAMEGFVSDLRQVRRALEAVGAGRSRAARS